MADPPYVETPLAVAVHTSHDNPVCGHGTEVRVDDDAAGPYIVLRQHRTDHSGKTALAEVQLDLPELLRIVRAARKLIRAHQQRARERGEFL